MKIDDITLSKLFYNQSLHDYFMLCGGIQVDYESHIDRILDFTEEIRKHDVIHSDRIGQDVTLMLQLSAQINGRAELTNEDFEFVRELWLKTCEWIDVENLAYNTPGGSRAPPEWTIQSIKKEIYIQMGEFVGSQKYYGTNRGYVRIADNLCERGADWGLVDHTITKYRESANQ